VVPLLTLLGLVVDVIVVVPPTVGALTVTSTVNTDPGQSFAVGVTVYRTIPAVVPLLVKDWAIVFVVPVVKPEMLPPVGVEIIAEVQLYVVPLTVEFNVTFVGKPLQTVCVMAEPVGFGLTVTSTVKADPGQEFAVGVTV
jgi:hypothetical protein